MVAMSVGFGWLAAGRVLKPLRTITTATRRIPATSLNERLDFAHDGLDAASTLDPGLSCSRSQVRRAQWAASAVRGHWAQAATRKPAATTASPPLAARYFRLLARATERSPRCVLTGTF